MCYYDKFIIYLNGDGCMQKRNRSEGWIYAKNSGHNNEELVRLRLETDAEFRNHFLNQIGLESKRIKQVSVGGIHEKDVLSVLGKSKTKSKTDLHVLFDDDSYINVSIKKSTGGQVYLITHDHFINGFEKQFNTIIPENIKRAIELFWGSAVDIPEIVNNIGTNKNYEFRKHRIVGDTLSVYSNELYLGLLEWMKKNMHNLVLFCFSTGLAAEEKDWADVIWYINELGDETFNYACRIELLAKKAHENADLYVFYGNRGHGTTIRLPFGFVQWHSPQKVIPGCLQFHHDLNLIRRVINNGSI